MAADETTRTELSDTSAQSSPHIRLRVDLVVEIADADVLTRSALDHIARDELMPDEERADAEEVVRGDAGEALACLVDPFDLVRELPGVELAHASWGSEEMDADDLDAFSFLEGAGGLDDEEHEHDHEHNRTHDHEHEHEYDREDDNEHGRDQSGEDPAAGLPDESGPADFDEPLDDLEQDFREDIHGEFRGLDGVRR
ncbi:hypothetical protein [Streptomyces sp. WMMB 322]|uniref:hypothetical protein n=1 Tax=Streptomyces sp. WMMB 322 TaxID=1286821 RepID=UPI00082377C3|nr:hypothetical protein [Streptomyces sp. WMMB 322]SCK26993.1 hypothetical protein H180DRAFT_02079 [Streptomyces sp. WMMB 322]